MMKELIKNFPAQLRTAIDIGKKNQLNFAKENFNQVIVSGLGGSGIGASIVEEYVFDKLSIPFKVNKGYFIPKSVNAQTLFIACSYSGNTEETLQAVHFAKKAGAKIVCISSGGELIKFATKHKIDFFQIPEGMPPRACLGYSLIQILYTLKKAGLLKANFEKEILNSIALIEGDSKTIQKQAKSIAAKLLNKAIAIYTTIGHESFAIRFRQQLNENSKVLCWHNVIPEMTHNEIVGWKIASPNICVVNCYTANDYEKNLKRLHILQKVVKSCGAQQVDIVIKGENFWEQCFQFIHLTDWISVYLADLLHHDAVEVKVIDHLKGQMAKK